jgi:hypothetical protein
LIFKVNQKSLKKLQKDFLRDVGQQLEAEFRDEFNGLKSYYGDGKMSDSIIFDETNKVLGSEEWGVAASDTGQDWNWSKFPSLDKIKLWVRTDYQRGAYVNAPDREVYNIAWFVANKIKNEGIESSFWVDEVLLDYTSTAGANGSGRE